ncbi:hypothetical protein [Sodaliphilus pleomorphus]|jgi:hypothetical protein|uniref:Uncharacterized protein n=1 Tax=Sodaliphilus pleomorphus TaxID=2606626 RepID=A0A6L5XAU7_9BACT|nr:hypothetical protein [Sodaliphilus pleomorphus]MSS16787.1 hypothetical protein [Sodaliphilus pleomorphus]
MIHDVGVQESFGFKNDPIVIRVYGKSVIGGRMLEVAGYTEEFIRKGQLIIRDETNEVSKPMPVTDGAYGTLPKGYVYEGVAKSTVAASEPLVGVMYEGEVNDVASPYPLTAEMLTALKSALPELKFTHD